MAENTGDSPQMFIKVNVLGVDNNVIQFKIKTHCHLIKLMNAYCAKSGLDRAITRFRFNGAAISETSTANSMGIKDKDVIEVFQHQTGGGLY
ncbi:small ubiquitin-related modifier 2-like [Rhopalosiphum padi]|uniref:small ubiquitin-related modifier 2-like n=1 Tax=Rhopalosiphum padi TaxID=40932 RepID=UPI00298ECF71|nr:small ubiquitin-related modifier 2-like [Rhopalosiphum padi]